jgi:hypothetical protein
MNTTSTHRTPAHRALAGLSLTTLLKAAGTTVAAVAIAGSLVSPAGAATTAAFTEHAPTLHAATAPSFEINTSADRCRPWKRYCGPMAKAMPSKKSTGSCTGRYEGCGVTSSPTGESYGPMAACQYDPNSCR